MLITAYHRINAMNMSSKLTSGTKVNAVRTLKILAKGIDIMLFSQHNKSMTNEIELPTLKCLRCGYEWIPRQPKKPKYCARCNSPYWDRLKVKQSGPQRKAEPSWMTKAYELDSGVRVFGKGKIKIENLSIDGPARRTITGKPSKGITSRRPSYIYHDDDRRSENETVYTHTVKEQTETGEWETVHKHTNKFKARRRPKKADEKP